MRHPDSRWRHTFVSPITTLTPVMRESPRQIAIGVVHGVQGCEGRTGVAWDSELGTRDWALGTRELAPPEGGARRWPPGQGRHERRAQELLRGSGELRPSSRRSPGLKSVRGPKYL